jgi:hypothetical protein
LSTCLCRQPRSARFGDTPLLKQTPHYTLNTPCSPSRLSLSLSISHHSRLDINISTSSQRHQSLIVALLSHRLFPVALPTHKLTILLPLVRHASLAARSAFALLSIILAPRAPPLSYLHPGTDPPHTREKRKTGNPFNFSQNTFTSVPAWFVRSNHNDQ